MDYNVDIEALSALAASLRAEQRKLVSTLDKLDGASKALAGVWSGDAQQAFAERQRDWQDALRAMIVILDAAASAGERNAENYRETDERVGALWGR